MRSKLTISASLIVIIWLVYLANIIIPVEFRQFGIVPRSTNGLIGIILAPFLHGGLGHIISNTLPLFFLTFALLFFYEKIAFKVWIISALAGGILVWLLARGNSVHIGASGVIFSLIGFLIASGIFQKSFKSILISIIILFLYGGAIWGVLPTQPGVSWEGHLFGFIVGVALAYFYRKTESRENNNNKLSQEI